MEGQYLDEVSTLCRATRHRSVAPAAPASASREGLCVKSSRGGGGSDGENDRSNNFTVGENDRSNKFTVPSVNNIMCQGSDSNGDFGCLKSSESSVVDAHSRDFRNENIENEVPRGLRLRETRTTSIDWETRLASRRNRRAAASASGEENCVTKARKYQNEKVNNNVPRNECDIKPLPDANLLNRITNLESGNEDLRTKVNKILAEKDGTIVHFGTVTLAGMKDAVDWCSDHPDYVQNFGRLISFHMFTILVHEQRHGSATNSKALVKMKLKNGQNWKTIMSYQRNVPVLFSTKQDVGGDNGTPSFDKYKKASSLDAMEASQLQRLSSKVQNDFQQGIDLKFKIGSPEHTLCTLALSCCYRAFYQFITFLTSQRDKFLSKGYDPANAWTLATRLGHTILVEIGNTRGSIQDDIDLDNITQTAILHLLATVRSLERMEKFMENNFEGDPAIGNSIIQYSMEFQRSDNNMEALNKNISLLRDETAKKYARKGDYITKSSLNSYAKTTELNKIANAQDDFVTTNHLAERLNEYIKK